jgi:hypothetical protein
MLAKLLSTSVIAFLIAVAVGCGQKQATIVQHPATSGAERVQTLLNADWEIDRELVADYYSGDGLGCNITLSLREDGNFSAKWTGCLGEYGNASGRWGRSGDRVMFVNRESRGMLDNYLRGATVVRGEDSPALVLDQMRDLYARHGLSRYWALQRMTADER